MYKACSESNAPDKITSERYTLERWRKNIYFENGCSLSKSFWARTAQINRLTGRDRQSALEPAIPSSSGDDGGAHFHHRARQGCQKLARIKLLVDNMLGEKTMSIIQMNFIKIAVKDEKRQNNEKDCRRHGFRCRRCLVCPAAKPSMKHPSRRLWLCPSQFSSQKDLNCRPRAGFCEGAKNRNPLAPHSGTFNGGEGIKSIRQPFYSPNTATADLFQFQRGKVEAGRPLAVPGGPMKNVEGVAWISCKNESTAAFRRYKDRCERYVWIALNRP